MKKKLLCIKLTVAFFALSYLGGNLMAQQNPDKGIGPVKNIELGPVNKKLADDGKALFTSKCTVCHDLDQKKIGPALRNITTIRTPEYFMNMMVTPQ